MINCNDLLQQTGLLKILEEKQTKNITVYDLTYFKLDTFKFIQKIKLLYMTTQEESIANRDPFDDENFDPIKYINEIFPNEESLENLDTIMSNVKSVRNLYNNLRKSTI